MPIDTCDCCGGNLQWSWEEAFDKFGFNNGDGQIETNQVADALNEAGYQTEQTMFRTIQNICGTCYLFSVSYDTNKSNEVAS